MKIKFNYSITLGFIIATSWLVFVTLLDWQPALVRVA